MKYFCYVNDRKGTCYHEFYKGKWDNKTFWKSDSILLDNDILSELEIYKAFLAVIPDYDSYGITEVNQSQWKAILDYASKLDTEALTALTEAIPWVNKVFKDEEVFTILGI